MSNPLIRSVEHFVLLEPDKEEKIVTRDEAIKWLKCWLIKVDSIRLNQKGEFEKETYISEFLENTCELEINQGYTIKWFAVRINPE